MPANRRVGRESRGARETSEDDSGDGVKGENDDKRSRKGPAGERLSRAVDALSEETLKDVAIATEQASSAVGTVESYSKMLRSLEDLLAKIDKSNVKEREMARKVMEEMDSYREKLFDAARRGIIKLDEADKKLCEGMPKQLRDRSDKNMAESAEKVEARQEKLNELHPTHGKDLAASLLSSDPVGDIKATIASHFFSNDGSATNPLVTNTDPKMFIEHHSFASWTATEQLNGPEKQIQKLRQRVDRGDMEFIKRLMSGKAVTTAELFDDEKDGYVDPKFKDDESEEAAKSDFNIGNYNYTTRPHTRFTSGGNIVREAFDNKENLEPKEIPAKVKEAREAEREASNAEWDAKYKEDFMRLRETISIDPEVGDLFKKLLPSERSALLVQALRIHPKGSSDRKTDTKSPPAISADETKAQAFDAQLECLKSVLQGYKLRLETDGPEGITEPVVKKDGTAEAGRPIMAVVRNLQDFRTEICKEDNVYIEDILGGLCMLDEDMME